MATTSKMESLVRYTYPISKSSINEAMRDARERILMAIKENKVLIGYKEKDLDEDDEPIYEVATKEEATEEVDNIFKQVMYIVDTTCRSNKVTDELLKEFSKKSEMEIFEAYNQRIMNQPLMFEDVYDEGIEDEE